MTSIIHERLQHATTGGDRSHAEVREPDRLLIVGHGI